MPECEEGQLSNFHVWGEREGERDPQKKLYKKDSSGEGRQLDPCSPSFMLKISLLHGSLCPAPVGSGCFPCLVTAVLFTHTLGSHFASLWGVAPLLSRCQVSSGHFWSQVPDR